VFNFVEWQVSRFHSNFLQRWWNEEEESDDDDDFFFVGAILEGLKRKKPQKKFCVSLPGRHNAPRDILGGHDRIHLDYFSDRPVYNEKHFRRRFWMSKTLFLQIVTVVESHDEYFHQKRVFPIQKVVGAFCMLAYGVFVDFLYDYVRMVECTIIESLKHFVKAVVDFFGDKYLRAPNAQDTARLMAMNSARGFPGMLGSIDCMHWRGAYTGHKDGSTMILEAVASQDLWIWHSFFRLPGSLNDINVLIGLHFSRV
jgi:hypothetical protein